MGLEVIRVKLAYLFFVGAILVWFFSFALTTVRLRDLQIHTGVPQTLNLEAVETFVKYTADQTSFAQFSFYVDVYRRNANERLLIVRPIGWYVYSVDDDFHYLTYVAGHKCLPDQCSTIRLHAIDDWENVDSTFDHGCLGISQIELLNIFAKCNVNVRYARYSLDDLLENSADKSVTVVEVINHLLRYERL